MKNKILSIIILLLICASASAYEPIEQLKPRAEAGNAQAQYNLAALYEVGYWGVSKDESLAIKWYRLAAAQGHQAAKGAILYIETKNQEAAALVTTVAEATKDPAAAQKEEPDVVKRVEREKPPAKTQVKTIAEGASPELSDEEIEKLLKKCQSYFDKYTLPYLDDSFSEEEIEEIRQEEILECMLILADTSDPSIFGEEP